MNYNQIEVDNTLKRLFKITSIIKEIYDDLSMNSTNIKKTKELEENLALTLSVEDNIYKELDDEILSQDLFYQRLSYLLYYRTDYKDKNLIENRIINYISQKMGLNPFLYISNDKDEYKEENSFTINIQLTIDSVKSILLTLDEEISKTTDINLKNKLIKSKNGILFSNKLVAALMKKQKYHQLNGRERCLIFNHDENLVNSIYLNNAIKISNHCINNILFNKDNIFYQIQLKSVLKLLNEKEINYIANSYINFFNNEETLKLIRNNPNHEIIANIINSSHKTERLNIYKK